jgi:hypothetical protein
LQSFEIDLDSLRIVDFYLDDDSRLDHPGAIDAKRIGAAHKKLYIYIGAWGWVGGVGGGLGGLF